MLSASNEAEAGETRPTVCPSTRRFGLMIRRASGCFDAAPMDGAIAAAAASFAKSRRFHITRFYGDVDSAREGRIIRPRCCRNEVPACEVSSDCLPFRSGAVAQLGERLNRTQEVIGSIP